MLKNCFPSNLQLPFPSKQLLQRPLQVALPLRRVQACLGSSRECDPSRHQLQLRQGYFAVVDIKDEAVLSCCECRPTISVLLRKTATDMGEEEEGQRGKKTNQMMARMTDNDAEGSQIGFFFDLEGREIVELYRIFGKSYTTQLDFHSIYRPLRKIGQGLTSNVYLVDRILDHATLAVKAFKKSAYFSSANGRGKEAFLREFKFLTMCQHEGLCRLEGVYETQNTIYIVQEYYHKSLGSILKGPKPLERRQVVAMMEDLLRATANLHSKGIFHRDIKLDNIMLRRDGNSYRPVLIDLGMAHHIQEPNYLFQKCGTPGYIAPEVFMEGAKDPKCDVFSLGVILHILLFKRPVFNGNSREELIKNNKNGEMSLCLSELEDELMKDLLLKLLNVNLEERPSCMEALQHPLFRKEPLTPETVLDSTEEMISERIYFEEQFIEQ